MKKRKWPTVSQILAEAVRIEFRFLDDDGRISGATYDTRTQRRVGGDGSFSVYVHQATAPNLLKAVAGAGWLRQVDGEHLVFTPPTQAGAATAPAV